MWKREVIKQRAKEVLRVNYWKAFLVSLVMTIIAVGEFSNLRTATGRVTNRFRYNYVPFNTGTSQTIINLSNKFILFLGSIAIVLIILRIVVGYSLQVGGTKFFIKATDGESNMNYLGYCFKERRYFPVVITMLLRSVYLYLWYLLLVIPGIIKTYSYRMVPYILADNPYIGYNRAIELSNEMTRGQKWDMFVLDLSFIGWYILGALAFGVGTLFVNPYANSTLAELYLSLRENAIERELTSYEELNLQYKS
ncbi:DUF975 family protein [Clostridium oceanicum]|uniref:DUF975 family protein n=1 Tax=Clostridium oceanicum TaxID=1543 RepID=A0ABP3UJN8_9CLOT